MSCQQTSGSASSVGPQSALCSFAHLQRGQLDRGSSRDSLGMPSTDLCKSAKERELTCPKRQCQRARSCEVVRTRIGLDVVCAKCATGVSSDIPSGRDWDVRSASVGATRESVYKSPRIGQRVNLTDELQLEQSINCRLAVSSTRSESVEYPRHPIDLATASGEQMVAGIWGV